MKTTFLTILLMTIMTLLYAQSPPNGTIWHYNQKDKSGKNGKSFSYKIVGDTIINQKTCKVIKDGFGCSALPSFGEILSYEGKKVFWYDRSLRTFKLLYDFGANAGDVLQVGLQKGSMQLFNVRVDSVKDIVIGSEAFRIQYLKLVGPLFDYVFGGEAIERAGCAFNFFPQLGACDPLQNGGLRCYNEPNKAFFKITADPCEATSIRETNYITDNTIAIYPNPSVSTLNLTLEKEIADGYSIVVYSILGQSMFTKNYTFEKDISIDINAWQTGLYTIIVSNKKEGRWIGKFAKL
jgi:hypothetical protein